MCAAGGGDGCCCRTDFLFWGLKAALWGAALTLMGDLALPPFSTLFFPPPLLCWVFPCLTLPFQCQDFLHLPPHTSPLLVPTLLGQCPCLTPLGCCGVQAQPAVGRSLDSSLSCPHLPKGGSFVIVEEKTIYYGRSMSLLVRSLPLLPCDSCFFCLWLPEQPARFLKGPGSPLRPTHWKLDESVSILRKDSKPLQLESTRGLWVIFIVLWCQGRLN